jgi:DNA-binding MarR family transcriptional regulator
MPYIEYDVRMRITHQTRLLFQAFLDAPGDETWGFELSRASGLSAGTIYPMLRRLEDQGLIVSRWEQINESQCKRRRRRYYRLSGEGKQVARKETQGARQALRSLSPGWLPPPVLHPAAVK